MQPFPKVDDLEILQVKMRIQFLIFWVLFVEFKGFDPFLFIHWRNGSADQFIIGYGKARVGQPRYSADNNHNENKRTANQKPRNNGFVFLHSKGLWKQRSLAYFERRPLLQFLLQKYDRTAKKHLI